MTVFTLCGGFCKLLWRLVAMLLNIVINHIWHGVDMPVTKSENDIPAACFAVTVFADVSSRAILPQPLHARGPYGMLDAREQKRA
jgi:hypothetical protein